MDWFKSIIEKRSLEHFEFLLASSLAVGDIDYGMVEIALELI